MHARLNLATSVGLCCWWLLTAPMAGEIDLQKVYPLPSGTDSIGPLFVTCNRPESCIEIGTFESLPKGKSITARDIKTASGSNLTFESWLGFPMRARRASLRDADETERDFPGRYSPAQSCGARPQRAAEARLAG